MLEARPKIDHGENDFSYIKSRADRCCSSSRTYSCQIGNFFYPRLYYPNDESQYGGVRYGETVNCNREFWWVWSTFCPMCIHNEGENCSHASSILMRLRRSGEIEAIIFHFVNPDQKPKWPLSWHNGSSMSILSKLLQFCILNWVIRIISCLIGQDKWSNYF